jgi:RNA polymerase sporulation-specific sigma factor
MSMSEKKSGAYDANVELLRAWREGDADAGERLAVLNTPLVYNIASRFSGRGVDFEELVEAGNIGLVKAINTFDFERGCAFSTYAVPLIFGEIRRFLRDDGLIKVSREEKRLSALLSAERERRLAHSDRVDIDSLATAVGVSSQDAAAAIFSQAPVRSLDEHAYDGDDTHTLADTVAEDGAVERGFERLALRMALDKLSPFHRRLIILRYFRDMSQVECASVMGISQVKVSREEKKILASLRRELD